MKYLTFRFPRIAIFLAMVTATLFFAGTFEYTQADSRTTIPIPAQSITNVGSAHDPEWAANWNLADAEQFRPAHYVGPGGDAITCSATNHPCIWTWDWPDNNTLLLPTQGWMGAFGWGDHGIPTNYIVNVQT